MGGKTIDPSKGGDQPAKSSICTICGSSFPSKSKLFKHLPTHGIKAEEDTKLKKTCFVVGWLRGKNGNTSSNWVGSNLVAAIDRLDGVHQDRVAFSAAQCGTSSSLAGYARAEPDHSAIADIWMIPVLALTEKTPEALESWLSRLNTILKDEMKVGICVMDRITLPVKDLDVESACSARVYESLLPVEDVLPADTPEGNALIDSLFTYAQAWKVSLGLKEIDASLYDEDCTRTWQPGKRTPNKTFLKTSRSRKFFGALKQIMKKICDNAPGENGNRSWHNVTTARASPGDTSAKKRMGRFYHVGLVEIDGRQWARFRLAGHTLLTGQVRCMIGLMLGISRGTLPPEIIDVVLSDEIFDVPAVPGWLSYVYETKFEKWETRHFQVLDARRVDRLEKCERKSENPKKKKQRMKKRRDDSGSDTDRRDDLERHLSTDQHNEAVAEVIPIEVLDARRMETPEKLARADQAILTWESQVLTHVSELLAEDSSWLKTFDEECCSVVSKYSTLHQLATREFHGDTKYSETPDAYLEVLRLLREADRSGLWPESTEARKRVIDEAVTGGNKNGGTFSVGAMPAGMEAPRGNSLFPELLRAAFRLERVIAPHRKPSATIAINRHAAFRPHRDSGAGAGQTLSCIVALGDFEGGEIVVEGKAYDLRYKPVEFDGWKQRHWTLPFKGERFSLVYFSPLGVTDDRLFWNTEL